MISSALQQKWKEYRNSILWKFVLKDNRNKEEIINSWCQQGFLIPHLITWEMVKDRQDKSEDFWSNVSYFVTPTIVEENFHSSWDWFELSRNPRMTKEYIQSHLFYSWNLLGLCQNPNVTFDMINSEHLWKFFYVINPNTTLQFISQFPTEKWNISYLARNGHVTWKEIQKLQVKMTLNEYVAFRNPCVSLQHLQKTIQTHFHDKVYAIYMHRPFWSDYEEFIKVYFTSQVLRELYEVYYHPSRISKLYAHGFLEL